MPAPFRRRTLIKAAGTALSALPLRGFAITEASPVHFTHHVASGDPLTDRVMLWTRILPGDGAVRAVPCRWEIAPTAEFTTLVASGTATAASGAPARARPTTSSWTPGTRRRRARKELSLCLPVTCGWGRAASATTPSPRRLMSPRPTHAGAALEGCPGA